MKITSVSRINGARHYPQLLDLSVYDSFELLPSGVIVARRNDIPTVDLLHVWDSAVAVEESAPAAQPPTQASTPSVPKPTVTAPKKNR
jgi:hypothetical protein